MKDADLMMLVDGELDEAEARKLEDQLARDPVARGKLDSIGELGELVRGHLELSADALPQKKLDALWKEIDKGIDRESAASAKEPAKAAKAPAGSFRLLGRRLGRWFDAYRGHIITGAVSAGAVGALALILRTPSEKVIVHDGHPVDNMPVVHRPAEIEDLDTPGGTGTVFNMEDDDGDTTVIWVTPDDTVEGI